MGMTRTNRGAQPTQGGTGFTASGLDPPKHRHILKTMPSLTSDWAAPNPREELGLVALDFELTAERVISAYRHGIFPWPDGDPRHPVPWVCPRRRAILEFEAMRIPRSLAKARRQTKLRFTINQAFRRQLEVERNQPEFLPGIRRGPNRLRRRHRGIMRRRWAGSRSEPLERRFRLASAVRRDS